MGLFTAGSGDASFEDADVKAIAAAVVRVRNQTLVKFVRDALRGDWRQRVEDVFQMQRGDADLLRAAREVADAGWRIATKPQSEANDLRGAVVHRIAYELIRAREPNVMVEATAPLLPKPTRRVQHAKSNPKDVVVESDHVEVYEAKSHPQWLDQGDLDELADIRDKVMQAGQEVACGVLALASAIAVKAQLAGLRVPRPLYWVSETEMLDLGDAKAYQPA